MKFILPFILLFSLSASASSTGPSRGVPGEIFAFAGTSCPAHAISTDGTSYLRAGQYANLFTAISTSYGTADGTHFNSPDFRGKFIRGVDGSASNDPDHGARSACATGGATNNNVGSCQSFAFQDHTHSYFSADSTAAGPGPYVVDQNNPASSHATTGATGSVSTETRPLNVYVLYCIWY